MKKLGVVLQVISYSICPMYDDSPAAPVTALVTTVPVRTSDVLASVSYTDVVVFAFP